MRIVFASVGAAAAALTAASILGVASAEAPTTTPTRTVNVEGVAVVPISQQANAGQANATYRLGMAAAVSDGQSKAEFLAGKAAAALGPVQTVVEGGGYIQCVGSGEAGGAEYEGAQPDFGSGPVIRPLQATGVSSPQPGASLNTPAGRHRRHRKRPTAKRAAAATCQLSTRVELTYAIS
jgi:hypothetical protein